jgi:hypothetical protein
MRKVRPYDRPARKPLATFPAASNVAAASLALIATVVSMSERLPPAVDQHRGSGILLFGKIPDDKQIVFAKRQIPDDESATDTLELIATASSRFSGFTSRPLRYN